MQQQQLGRQHVQQNGMAPAAMAQQDAGALLYTASQAPSSSCKFVECSRYLCNPAICCHPPPTCNDEDGVGPRLAHQHLLHVIGIQLNQAGALQRLHASNLQGQKKATSP